MTRKSLRPLEIRLPMKRFSVSLLMLVLVAGLFAMATGCAVALIGAGAGAATAAYVMGELTQTYESGYSEAIQASTETLGALKIQVVERVGDELQTAVKARRPDGTPVEIDIARIDEKRAEIGVRTGHVGVWDHRTSRQIQDMIGERLARQSNKEKASGRIDPPPEPKLEGPVPGGEPEPPKKKANAKTAAYSPLPPSPVPPHTSDASFNPDLTLFFASGVDAVAPEEIEKLDRVAAVLRAHPLTVASLHGYSDSRGKASQNFILSVGRADSVKRYLGEKGCSPDQVLVIGHGSAKFLGSNDTEAGRRLNRRVEIELHNAP